MSGLSKVIALGNKGVGWVMSVPKPTPLAAGAKLNVIDYDKLPANLSELTWDKVPKEWNPFTPKDKVWSPVTPAQFNFRDFNNYIDDPEAGKTAHRGRISTLLFVGFVLTLWVRGKRTKEIVGLDHSPAECLRWF